MRAALIVVMAVTGLLVLAESGSAGVTVSQCPTSAGMKDASKQTRPSSFAPGRRSANHAYGQPIGDKILTKRVKKKPGAGNPPST